VTTKENIGKGIFSMQHTTLRSLVSVCVVIIGVVVAPAPPPVFFASVIDSIPENYVVASLADLATTEFSTSYRFPGINFLDSIPVTPCCVISVAEGFLSFGPSDKDSNFLQPFLPDDGSSACRSGTTPSRTTLGISAASPGPLNGTILYPLSPEEQAEFRVTTASPSSSATYGNCTSSSPTSTDLAIVKLQYRYVVRPTSLTPGYTIATLKDVQSAEFSNAYNYNRGSIQLTVEASQESDYCCMLRVAEGWLAYGSAAQPNGYSPMTLYNSGYNWICSGFTGSVWGEMGAAFGGPNSGTVFFSLNETVTEQFSVFTTNLQNWSSCGENLTNTLTLYKRE
jgi:hypothetical protein